MKADIKKMHSYFSDIIQKDSSNLYSKMIQSFKEYIWPGCVLPAIN